MIKSDLDKVISGSDFNPDQTGREEIYPLIKDGQFFAAINGKGNEPINHFPLTAALYFDSLFCMSCTMALQSCQEINGRIVSATYDGHLRSAWFQSIKSDVNMMISHAMQFLDLLKVVDTDPFKLLAKEEYSFLATPCPEELEDYLCTYLLEKRVKDLILRLNLLYTQREGKNYVCLHEVDDLTQLWSKDVIRTSPATSKFYEMVSTANKFVGIRSSPHRQTNPSSDFNKFLESASTSAVHMASETICPHTDKIRWAFHFTSTLEHDLVGTPFNPPVKTSMRMVFNPASVMSPWIFQRQDGRNSENWKELLINPEATYPTPARDVFSTAIAGLEFWSSSQKEFANILLTWMVTITRRSGVLPSRLGKLLKVLGDLGSSHRIVLEVNHKESSGVEKIEEDLDKASLAMDEIDASFGAAPEAVTSWINTLSPSTEAALPEVLATALGGMSMGFAAITTGFMLWNAIFVDSTVTERLYSTAQGGFVWADVFIHLALALATNGISVPIAATAGVYVAAAELFAVLKRQPWFIKKFPTLAHRTPDDLRKMFERRRTQVCFSAFYSATSVAEGIARDLWAMKSEKNGLEAFREAVSFDRPSPEDLVARMKDPSRLFEDILLNLMHGTPAGAYHNIKQHKMSLLPGRRFVPLKICGHTITPPDSWSLPVRLYIQPETARWDLYLPRVDLTKYENCRLEMKAGHRLTPILGTRMPCSPSEMVAAFYHYVRKYDTHSLLQKQMKSGADKILRVIASPTSAIATLSRSRVIEMVDGARQLQTKVFLNQDIGILNVWFTLNVFHMVTFGSTNRRDVQVFDKKNHESVLTQQENEDSLMVCDTYDIFADYFSNSGKSCGSVKKVTADPLTQEQKMKRDAMTHQHVVHARSTQEEHFMVRSLINSGVQPKPIRVATSI
eukprot:c8696_g1_i1.p1 GENE.c8696_g1_i1~~c8696_g1_i1.p1  ORF type:complete len:976 (-),score=256.57 c8696_g1_i1:43-2757(-)